VDEEIKKTISALMRDKGLSRLGDAFVNFAYSSAKTRVRGMPFGEKVPDRVLSMALEIAKVPVPSRLSHGERGDIAEALLAHVWMGRRLSLEEAVDILATGMSKGEYESRALERELSAKAFSDLIKLAVDIIERGDPNA
jgi:hypothetical protein